MRIPRVGMLLALGVLTSSLFAQAWAQEFGGTSENPISPSKGDIAGYVRPPGSEKLGTSFLVRLETSTGMLIDQTWTDRQGRFNFMEVSCGSYVLATTASGYRLVRRQVEHSYEPMEGVILRLVRMENGGGAATSTRELLVPKSARKEYEKGLRAFANRKAKKSAGHFGTAIQIYPKYDDAYIQLGLIYLEQGAFVEAQQVLEKAIGVHDGNARAHALLGSVFRMQNQFQESVRALERSLSLNETSWLTHLELGKTLLSLKKVEEAYDHIAGAHELNAGASSTHILLYNTLILRNEYQAALSELEEFLALFPKHSFASQARQHYQALRKHVAEQQQLAERH